MPGLALLLEAEGDIRMPQFRAALELMLHGADYRAIVETSAPGIMVGRVAYPEYPIRFIEFGGKVVAFEGRIYGCDAAEVDCDLRQLASLAFSHPEDFADAARRWILERDGEYIVMIAAPDNRELLLFNDALGRLPLFYSAAGGALFAARECKFVARLANAGFDRLGWAQVLWLGYPIGGRTLFEGIKRLPSGSLLTARSLDGRVISNLTKLFELNFDHKDTTSSIDEHVEDLVPLLIDSCRRRGLHQDVAMNVVSLSGGLDSRAVLAALAQGEARCTAVTFITESGRGARDRDLARVIAGRLDVPWESVEVPDADEEARRRLVILKDGHNYVALAFILSFMDALVTRWGRSSMYVTGDGGDKLLPSLVPPGTIGSMTALVRHVAEREAVTPSSAAEAVLGLAPGTLETELRRVLTTYPEEDHALNAVHFAIHERGMQWLFEGEDRARFFMWQTSPFYSLAFLRRAMQIPDHMKANHRLYRRFQMRLAPDLAGIPDADLGLPISSPWFSYKVKVIDHALRVPRRYRRMVKIGLGRQRAVTLSDEMLAATGEDSILDVGAARAWLSRGNDSTAANWMTLVLLESLSKQNRGRPA